MHIGLLLHDLGTLNLGPDHESVHWTFDVAIWTLLGVLGCDSNKVRITNISGHIKVWLTTRNINNTGCHICEMMSLLLMLLLK